MSVISDVSSWIIPGLITIVLIYSLFKKVPSYELFVEGGKEGIKIAISIIPYLVGMLVAITTFKTSGLMDFLIKFVSPFFSTLQVPSEIVPIALIRPISGNAALAMVNNVLATNGPDSFIGKLASVVHGSNDTTMFVLTVYFGAIGMKKMGDAVKIALIGDIFGVVSAIFIVIYLWK